MAEKHYYEQKRFAQSYLIPFLHNNIPGFKGLRILEVGCAEAGFLDQLQRAGMQCAGIELEKARVDLALEKNEQLNLYVGDITDADFCEQIGTFDLIVAREVIEHVPDRQKMFANMNKLLNPGGFLYITFPPRFSPFAGHQQNGRTFLRYLPFLHYLPAAGLEWLGRMAGEPDYHIQNIIRNYRDGLSLRRFRHYVGSFSFDILVWDLFFIRPVFSYRYGWKPLRLPDIPLLREIFTLGCETILQKKH